MAEKKKDSAAKDSGALRTVSAVGELPSRLSPSRINDYLSCPKAFYYKTVQNMSSPPTWATILGNCAHTVFEHMFDYPEDQRTWESAKEWVDVFVNELDEQSLEIVEQGGGIAKLKEETAKHVQNWEKMERLHNFSPENLQLPDGTVIDGRELHLEAQFDDLTIHGFVDRLDSWKSSTGKPLWSITDYKTGKVPSSRWVDKYWVQLRIYGRLLEKQYGASPEMLRLVFTKAGSKAGIFSIKFSEQVALSTDKSVKTVWKNMKRDYERDKWETKTGPLCSWCFFQNICPAFNPDLPLTDG